MFFQTFIIIFHPVYCMLFAEKYFPKKWEEFVGNPAVLETVQKWANGWSQGKAQKPLFFYGSCGTGKTALAILTSKMMGWQFFELNASDFRTKETINKFAGSASMASSFFGNLRLILLDEVDGVSSKDRGGITAIIEILKNSKNPIILTANDLYAQNISGIRNYCENLQFKKINYLSIEKKMKEICLAEKIPYEEEALKRLAQSSEGDLRAALLDLQTLSLFGSISLKNVLELSERLKLEDVFKTLNLIFNSKDIGEIKRIMADSKEDLDILLNWILENIPRALKPEEAALAFDRFSRGDVLEGRILHSQYYGFRRYSIDLMSSAALAKGEHKPSWINYQFPSFLRQMSASISSRALNKAICKKIGSKIHSSIRAVQQNELPIIKQQFKQEETAANLSCLFGFDEDEIAFLCEAKSDSKKVQNIFEDSKKLKELSIKEKYGPAKGHVALIPPSSKNSRNLHDKTEFKKSKRLEKSEHKHKTEKHAEKEVKHAAHEKQTMLFK